MEENTVLREDVLAEAIKILEIEGIANTSLEMVAERVSCRNERPETLLA